jgi:tetratricopeptide (TPR) repeat protein
MEAELGWNAYQAGDIAAARVHFETALGRCAGDQYARTGLGYVELREDGTARAEALFTVVVAAEPTNVDARVGLGLARWRAGDLDGVLEQFTRVVELSPGHPTALEYLELMEGRVLGPAPERPPLTLPETLTYPSRTVGDRFEIRTADGWTPFYAKGVNLGAALPGMHASEFPDSATYALWLRRMAEMNANTVRVYTIHPPAFYAALRDWNTRHPDRTLWLIHGVWTELPPGDDYRSPAFESEFFSEMRDVVDLLHGRADIEPRPSRAFGYYTSDVSPWTLAYIIGREWEPYSAMAFDSIRGGEQGFDGVYVQVAGGNALDAWMGRAIEEIVAYETDTYRAQRPVAYTNWPTLDPLDHPTEATVEEEMAIRRALGESPDVRVREYDNDGLALDAMLVSATERLPAGYFASYHAYPYYPDFMILGQDFQSAESTMGRSNYMGYLRALKQHHRGMPLLISEYGVPASLGVAHLQPQGWHHGGLTEEEMARVNERLTLELAEAGMAGGVLFAWIDEWFKKNWVALEFELPPDRNRLWYNRLDAEQHYGLWAMEATPAVPGRTFEERRSPWRDVAPLYTGAELTLRVASDEAYLWLLLETPRAEPGDTVMVGFDVIHPTEGDFAWPGGAGARLPVGVEFVLQAIGDEVRMLADPPSNPFRHVEVGQGARGLEGRVTPVANPPAGLFYSREEQRFNFPYYTESNEDGRYDSLRVIVNRRRFTRDSIEYLAIGYDRGVLPTGNAPDGLWERSADGATLEVRVPWLLINVTDPSSRTVLQGPGDADTSGAVRGADGRWRLRAGVTAWPDSVSGELGTVRVEGIGLVASILGGEGATATVPASGDSVASYSWETWEVPRYVERARPTYDALRDLYAQLDPYAGNPSIHPGAEPPPSGAVTGAVSDASASQVDEADAAWRSGDTDRARVLYEARLREDPDDGVALHRLALMRAWTEDFAASLELFSRLLRIEPLNLDARVDRARVRAWQGETDRALAEIAEVLGEHPDHAGALEARALFEAWEGRYEASLSSYERLLSISPDHGEARLQRARVLVWAAESEGSRQAFERLLAEDPDDIEARLGLARTLAFSDELEAAIVEYDKILAADPRNIPARQGKGRTLGWAGRLIEGEEVLRQAVAIDGANADTYVALGQILQWQGRGAAAKEALETAVGLSPTHGDAREQLRTVNLAFAPRAHPAARYESDSDGNRMVTTALTASWHPSPRLELRMDGYRRDLDHGALRRDVLGGSLTGVVEVEPGWAITLGAGAGLSDAVGTSSYASFRGGLRSPGRHALGASVDVASQVLDETAALAERGVRYTSYAANLRWTPAPGWRVDGAAGYAQFAGTEDNTRVSGSLTASRRLGGQFSVGVGFRTFSFERDLDDAYFDPDRYALGELTGYWRRTPAPWSLLIEAAPGVQQVTHEGDPSLSLRGSARVGYMVAPGRELSLSLGYSTAGLSSFSTGSADYTYTAIILGFDWVF